MSAEVVKRITGGLEIMFRELYGNYQTRRTTATIFGAVNGQLQLDLSAGAERDRYNPVPMPRIPAVLQNPRLVRGWEPDFPDNPARRQALLTALLDVLAGLGGAAPATPDRVLEAREADALSQMGEVGLWVKENIVRRHGHVTSTAAAFEAFKATADIDSDRLAKYTQARFTKEVQSALGLKARPGKPTDRDDQTLLRCWYNVAIAGAQPTPTTVEVGAG